MQVVHLLKHDDGSVSERISEAELTALARRYLAALLREVEESVGTVTIRLREPGEEKEAAGDGGVCKGHPVRR